MTYTSGDTADADAIEAAMMRARKANEPPPLTLTGAQRQFLIAQMTTSLQAHEHARRGSKVRFEQQRHATAADGLRIAIDVLSPTEKP